MCGYFEPSNDDERVRWAKRPTTAHCALRWPLPTDLANELEAGRALTQYLARGSASATPVFTHPQPE